MYLLLFWDIKKVIYIDFYNILLDKKPYKKLLNYNFWLKTFMGEKAFCEKSSVIDSINHNFARIGIDSCNSLPLTKVLTFHNVIILIKSVVNENKNHYYYNILLENGSYEDKSNAKYF